LEESAVSQICDVRFLTGEAEVQMRFDQDEVGILSTGTLVNITFPEDNLSVINQMEYPLLAPSSKIYYDQLAIILEKDKHKWAVLTDWVSMALTDIMDGVHDVSYSLTNIDL
jgi:hypothetical protein